MFSQITLMLFAVYENAGLDSFGMTKQDVEWLGISERLEGESIQ